MRSGKSLESRGWRHLRGFAGNLCGGGGHSSFEKDKEDNDEEEEEEEDKEEKEKYGAISSVLQKPVQGWRIGGGHSSFDLTHCHYCFLYQGQQI